MEHKIATFLSPQFKKLKMLNDVKKIEVTEEIKIKIEIIKNYANYIQEIINVTHSIIICTTKTKQS